MDRTVDVAGVLDGLTADSAALVALLGSLRGPDFARATPCAAWDGTHLTAHLYRDSERTPEALAAVTDESVDTDSLTYWRYDRAENQAQTQARATSIAAAFASPKALVDELT